jgi:hypothetical protein
MVPRAARHRACGDGDVENGLLCGVGHRLEQGINVILVEKAVVGPWCLLIMQENIVGGAV